jgi:hypothetical protein
MDKTAYTSSTRGVEPVERRESRSDAERGDEGQQLRPPRQASRRALSPKAVAP